MSDARRMNQEITSYLKQTFEGTVHDSHVLALAVMITGLIRSKASNLDEMERKSGHHGRSKFPSRVKLIHRFIKNKPVSYKMQFMPFGVSVSKMLNIRSRPHYTTGDSDLSS